MYIIYFKKTSIESCPRSLGAHVVKFNSKAVESGVTSARGEFATWWWESTRNVICVESNPIGKNGW